MKTSRLNLARSWRSRTFDEIIGQDLSVRLVKNSLYRGQFFPVYLFAGQRGCGKTTMGRVFAAAANCARLEEFQQRPQETSLPCLACTSCQAMAQNNHPDFIEIDAASHTGVDNVRTIIEAASFLPVLGRFKIYLIDEAHMLSKAAFNAFLKILEEPPRSVIFFLATTEAHKIIDTVRSRCFQLFFTPVAHDTLVGHLATICTQEAIVHDRQGLHLVVQETEGSVRDAINLIERVRLAEGAVTHEAVMRVMGILDDEAVLNLLEIIAQGSLPRVLEYCVQSNFLRHAPESIWKKIVECLSALIWIKHGAPKVGYASERLQKVAAVFSAERLTYFLSLWYEAELQLYKTTAQAGCIELLIFKMVQQVPVVSPQAGHISAPVKVIPKETSKPQVIAAPVHDARWQECLSAIDRLDDPLISSIFKQAQFQHVDAMAHVVQVIFSKEFVFFEDLLQSTRHIWQPVIQRIFGASMQFVPQFSEGVVQAVLQPKPDFVRPKVTATQELVGTEKRQNYQGYQARNTDSSSFVRGVKTYKAVARVEPREVVFDVSDTQKWQRAHELLRLFPGTITEVKEAA